MIERTPVRQQAPVQRGAKQRSVAPLASQPLLGRPGAVNGLQRRAGNQVMHRLVSSTIQPKLTINRPDEEYEREADRVADEVMRMPAAAPDIQRIAHSVQRKCRECEAAEIERAASDHVSRKCTACEQHEERKSEDETRVQAKLGDTPPSGAVDAVDKYLRSSSSRGRLLDPGTRSDLEARFGHDFQRVRVHDDAAAAASARSIGARAYTFGPDVVFGAGEFAPTTSNRRRLLAHELTHVVQQGHAYAYNRNDDIVLRAHHYRPHTFSGHQFLAHESTHVVQHGAAPRIQHRSVIENGEAVHRSGLHIGVADHVVQRLPGDGMEPPGDCSWARYLVLRGSVETAKAVVSMLGACSAGDNCLTLAIKIAAVTSEIVARVALAATCFRGGDSGHRRQIQDKINMVNRCYRFFSDSNCSPELIAAMAVVVESARAVIAAAAVTVALALVAALVAAIIALAEVIAGLAAAAAEAAAVATAAAAVIALLVKMRDEISPEGSSGA